MDDKQLHLIDLYARIPYGVKVLYRGAVVDLPRHQRSVKLSDCIPYLRPLSSMMQGEWEEMTALIYPYGRVNRNPDNKNELLLWLSAEGNDMPIILMDNVFSWLLEHHFDYRGLIERGLAVEAPKDIYK